MFTFFTDAHQQPRRRPPGPYAANAVPSRNLGKAVVAVVVVLGSETAEVLVTQNCVTLGMRAYRCAKHGHSSRQPVVN